MAIAGAVQNVTTTAVALGTGRANRKALIIRNPTGSGASIHIGGAAVTTATAAFTLAAGDQPLVITNDTYGSLAGEAWYGRTASGTATGVIVTEA